MQPDKALDSFVSQLVNKGYRIDLFTNGSIDFKKHQWVFHPHVSIIMDWKLRGSGEAETLLNVRSANRKLLGAKDSVKFVVKDRADLNEAHQWLNYWGGLPLHRVYFSPAWDKMNPAEIVAFIEDNQLHTAYLNIQTHKYVWDPKARRT